jgi:hypothetical protein
MSAASYHNRLAEGRASARRGAFAHRSFWIIARTEQGFKSALGAQIEGNSVMALADGVHVMRDGKLGIDLVSPCERLDCLSSYWYWPVVAESARMGKTTLVTLSPLR